MTTTERPAQPGETCDCGHPARTVYVTENFGDVPYCGVPRSGSDQTAELPSVAGWDPEGNARFERDELDDRYSVLLDRMREDDTHEGDRTSFAFDLGVGALVYSDAGLAVADEALEVLRALVARERLRARAVDEALGLTEV